MDGQGRFYTPTLLSGILAFTPTGRPFGSTTADGYAFGMTSGDNTIYTLTVAPRVYRIQPNP